MTSSTQLRTRDGIALLLLLYISSIAYNYNSNHDNDLSASIRFAFYIPQQQQQYRADGITASSELILSMLDIDGDDISEVLAVWKNNNNSSSSSNTEWTLQILDLSRISLSGMNSNSNNKKNQQQQQLVLSKMKKAPFRPNVIFNSSTVFGTTTSPHHQSDEGFIFDKNEIRYYPLVMTTGHIIFPDSRTDAKQQQTTGDKENVVKEEGVATNYYYCGNDWYDASQKCQQPCPSGSGCPNGERCFADCTSCPSSTSGVRDGNEKEDKEIDVEYHRTVANSWPSICTAWSQGHITMHTITAEKEIDPLFSSNNNNSSISNNKYQSSSSSSSSGQSKLRLRQLWNVSILVSDDTQNNNTNPMEPKLELEEVAITFVDPMTSEMIFVSNKQTDDKQNNNHGLVVVTGAITAYYYDVIEHQIPDYDFPLHTIEGTFVIAYDAYTGQRIWHTSSSYEMEQILYYPNHRSKMIAQQQQQQMNGLNGTDIVPEVSMLLPRHGQIGSISRRRSGMINTHQRQRMLNDEKMAYEEYENLKRHGTMSNINCLKEYRRSIFTTIGTLPYQYDGTKDYNTKIIVTHFDHQGITSSSTGSKQHAPPNNKKTSHAKTGRGKKMKKEHSKHNHVEYGRPNVVVVHNYQGIQVYALRNGRSLCHISLSDHTVYDDIDHDGRIDTVQLSNIGPYGSNLRSDTDRDDDEDDGNIARQKFYDKVTEQLILQNINGSSMNDDQSYGSNTNTDVVDGKDVVPCYALSVMSGFPAKEQTHIKSIKCQAMATTSSNDYYSTINHAPLLLIDTPIVTTTATPNQNHIRYYKDIVVALNNGMIGRIHGRYGNWLWKREVYGPMQQGTSDMPPTWDDPSMVTLQQLYVNHYKDTNSPMVLAGQNSIAIVSSMTGRVITTTPIPQISNQQRPYILDMNGDGTSDIVIVTNDAIWGYTILVRTTMGMSTGLRLLVGFVVMGLMLAYLRNRFGPHPGKRSTDL